MTTLERPDGLIGTVVQERYRVLSKIGEGGVGSVYVAEHTLIGRRFALKTLRPEFATKSGVVARFYREARAAAAIGDDHIVDVSDMGHLADGSPYIVMELLEGSDLAQLIDREGPLAMARAVRIVEQCCVALARAHDRGIVHRDIKPDNIFLTTEKGQADFVKLVDFGISKVLKEAAALDSFASITTTGVAVGTPLYMSPEQIAEGAVDHRTDVYSLGVVLFQILTGRFPFEANNYAALVTKIVREQPISIDTLRSDIPSELVAVISRMLAKRPEQRFDGMRELSAALEPFRNAPAQFSSFMSDAPTRIATPGAWESQSSRSLLSIASRKRVSVVAGIGAAIALTSVLWLAATRERDVPASAPPAPTKASRAAKATEVQRAVPRAPVAAPKPRAPVVLPSGSEGEPAPVASKPVLQPLAKPMVITRPRPSPSASPTEPATEPDAPRPQVGEPYDLQGGNPYRSGTPAKPSVQLGSRTLILRNTSRAAVTVELDCGGFAATRTIAAGSAGSITRPQRACRVHCTGIGGPRCPGVVEPAASSIQIE